MCDDDGSHGSTTTKGPFMATWETDADALRAKGARHILLLSHSDGARGQIAAGIARALAPRQVHISSAGVTKSSLDPLAARVLAELSVNISDRTSRNVAELDTSDVDAVVTLSEGDDLPASLRGAYRVHWPMPEPAAKGGSEDDRLSRYRTVRNELRRRFLRVFAHAASGASAQGRTTTTFEPAAGGDYEEIRSIIAASLLPSRTVGMPNQRFILARSDGRVIGCAGLEVYGADGQVRSLAVDWTRRNAGLGTRLHERLLQEAVLSGVRRLYVITATAEEFFARHGWKRVPLEEVPPAIRASEEFATLAPASAASMTRAVRA
jgi:N-acetylglutamate synthase-like GNAT family acetyltransferase/protein-tyrosine-phosphatase